MVAVGALTISVQGLGWSVEIGEQDTHGLCRKTLLAKEAATRAAEN